MIELYVVTVRPCTTVIACMGAKSNLHPQPPSAASVDRMHIHYIQQSGRSAKTMNAKNTVTSAVLGVGCHTYSHTHGYIVSSIIVSY